MMMVKVHILGGPGSGKTTLGKELATKFGVPHFDLDQHGKKNGTRHEAWVEDAAAIARQPGWIVENIGIIYIDPLLYAADAIVLLKISWPIAVRRILYRHISNVLRGNNQYPGLKSLFALLTGSRRIYLNIPPAVDIAEMMRAYLEEQRASTLPATPEELIKQCETYSALMIPPTMEFVRKYLEKYHEKVFVVKTKADRARLLAFLAEQVAPSLLRG